jgi:hypothetical protein
VIISDNDEGEGNLTDSHGNLLPNVPDYNKPQTLLNYVHQAFPQKSFKVHAVIRKPSDGSCNNDNIDAHKAFLYDSLVQSTGGVSANICHDMNRSEVDAIGQAIHTNPPVFTLQCVPKDTNGDGVPDVAATYSPQPATPIDVIVNGNIVTFNPVPPQGTVVHLQYECP